MRPLTPRRKVRLIRDAFDTLEQTGPEAGIEDDYYFIDLTDEEDIRNIQKTLDLLDDDDDVTDYWTNWDEQ